jgi:hypothetical protein
MTREEFIELLEEKGYSYKIEGDKLIVTHKGWVNLRSLKTIPSGVEFKNEGNINLRSLKILPSGVEFSNGGDVKLTSLVGVFFDVWKGNIEGIDSKKLLNLMIKQGVFI